VKIDEGQQKIKIVRTNRQSNLWGSCQSIFSLGRHHPRRGTTKIKKIVRTNRQSNLWGSCQSIFSLCRHRPCKRRVAQIGPIRNQNLIFSPMSCLNLHLLVMNPQRMWAILRSFGGQLFSRQEDTNLTL